ncbi:MAG TPA: NADP oxidoreductase [Cytophagales bacterium]|jgi:8-hydroxy-5-deazaflavin:NADPH oxidoreductase|nr:NADP oxidoreductase [Cytophagales bacterium]
MATVKTIAIVGATENIGSAIARILAKLNYRLLLMSGDQAKLKALKEELEKLEPKAGIDIVGCAKEASWEADIIIIATPYEAHKEVAEKIQEVATGKIVISVSNPINSNYGRVVPSANTSAAEELQKMLPYSKVVKTFNTQLASKYISAAFSDQTRDVFIAGNNSDAVTTVFELLHVAGFHPIISGDLSVSRTLERLQLSIQNQMPGAL